MESNVQVNSTELIKTFHVQYIVSRAKYMQGMQKYWKMFYFTQLLECPALPTGVMILCLFVSFVCRYSTHWVCHPSPTNW